MRLDRFKNDPTEMRGKYSIIENRNGGRIVHNGDPIDDFFVIKLKDINAEAGLLAYAASARANGDAELADDVQRLSQQAGINHLYSKIPD